ncbi:MAG: hypothetical protein O2951_12630 [Bacteroidetes bacterium]|nr:hypothetical protein [Bacteroidota bacterium]
MESAKVVGRGAAWREPAVALATNFIDGILKSKFLKAKIDAIGSLMLEGISIRKDQSVFNLR